MVERILLNQNRLFTASVYLEGDLGEEDINIGVPVIINKNGWDRIVPIELDEEEKQLFEASAQAVREMNKVLKDSDIL